MKRQVAKIIQQIKKTENTDYFCKRSSLNLTGKELKMNHIDLLILFVLVSKKYNVKFQAKDLIDYKFNSIDSIVSLIEMKL